MSTQSGNLRALCAHVDHRAGCGKCEICLAADQVEQLEIKNAELEKQVEMLQSGARSNIRLHVELSEVKKQRDMLLVVLEETNSCLLSALTGGSVKASQAAKALRDADAAIASVKGGAA